METRSTSARMMPSPRPRSGPPASAVAHFDDEPAPSDIRHEANRTVIAAIRVFDRIPGGFAGSQNHIVDAAMLETKLLEERAQRTP